jgi:LPS O-antigen subunit length determinant protein (WzzB/FepE family)
MLSFKEEQKMKNKGLLQKIRERDAIKSVEEEQEVQERKIKLMKIYHNQIQHIAQACQKV